MWFSGSWQTAGHLISKEIPRAWHQGIVLTYMATRIARALSHTFLGNRVVLKLAVTEGMSYEVERVCRV